jgi:anti-sigma-K factor RskA
VTDFALLHGEHRGRLTSIGLLTLSIWLWLVVAAAAVAVVVLAVVVLAGC